MDQHFNAEGMMRPDALKGKTIVITGGGSGLGKSMGRYFLQLGANLVIASRKLDKLEAAAKELEAETGGKVHCVACDVRDFAQVENLVAQTWATFGKADVLVNNAAGNFISPTERLSHRAFDAVVDIVLKGSYYCTLAFGKKWIEEKVQGNVLSILTTYAFTGSGYVVPSAVGKGGALALTHSLASEWAKYRIRLNAIAPGPFPTEGAWTRLVPPGLSGDLDWTKRIPMGRTGEHQELCNLAAYLVSDYSGYMTGECLTLDGGEWRYNAGQFSFLDKVPREMWDQIEQMIRMGSKNK